MKFVYQVYLRETVNKEYIATGEKIVTDRPLQEGRITTAREYKFIAKIDKIEYILLDCRVYLTKK